MLWDVWNSFLKYCTAEFVLAHKPNSGAVIMLRSLWTSAVIMCLAIGGDSMLDNGFSWGIDLNVLVRGFADHPTWFGLVFAAVYTAFYTRFSAQWKYLADLYNMQKSAFLKLTPTDRADQHTQRLLVSWKVGFVADALELHLFSKDLFGQVVIDYLGEAEVAREFDRLNGWGAAERLIRRVKDI